MTFSLYVALGDSMSTDHYPTCDVRDVDIPPNRLDPLGAASLLFHNDNARWPDFEGRDLRSQWPGVEFRQLAEDGAMIDDVASEELARLGRDSQDPGILITLTAGGNDLLDALLARRPLESAVSRIGWRYAELVASIRDELPLATLVLTTVYDPTDGTGRLPGLEGYGTLPLQYLDRFNQQVRETAGTTPGALLAEVQRDFLGHGVSAPEQERWYWHRNLIEPNARGASEIRRAWWKAVNSAR
jgi:lysophospholipase L1-like esterase